MGHGWRCPCSICKGSRARWSRERRMRQAAGKPGQCTLVDVTGTRRRVQAMCCLGYGLREQARLMSMQETGFRRIMRVPRIRYSTVEAVRRLYEELWDKPAPRTAWASRVRRRAKRLNWYPPLSWDDDTIDDPKAHPWSKVIPARPVPVIDDFAVSIVVHERKPMRLRGADRAEAARRLASAGLNKDQIRHLVSGVRR